MTTVEDLRKMAAALMVALEFIERLGAAQRCVHQQHEAAQP
jgi:hypothetical protein